MNNIVKEFNENIISVHITKDLEVELDFSKKHIFVYSSVWKTKVLKENGSKVEKEELPSNKKVRPSKAETQFEKFIQVFGMLSDYDPFNEGVPFSAIKKSLSENKIATTMSEINDLVNQAISEDRIEESQKTGYYKRKVNS